MTKQDAFIRAGACGLLCVATFLAIGTNIPSKQSRPGASSVSAFRGAAHSGLLPRPMSGAVLSTINQNRIQSPLAFEPNRGQSNSKAKFLARGIGYSLLLDRSEAILALGKTARPSATLHMKMVGATDALTFSALEELPGKSNYLIGDRPANWRTNIPNYRRVAERGIYKGIDLIYYGTQRQLEYDFTIAPGADPRDIRLAFQGADNVRTDAQGELVLSVKGGEVRLAKPVGYQEISGERHAVDVKYVLNAGRRVTFEVAAYSEKQPLIIDPILSYSTYLGGSNIDGSNAIAVGTDGTVFIAGGTFSTDFPTAHPLQANSGGGPDFPQDAFVAKVSADGSTLLYSTYLGGENQDIANGIAVDTFGNAYVTGTTLSPHFPVTAGSFDTLCGSDGECGAKLNMGLLVSNGFVTKLNAAGSGLLYSGFLGFDEDVRGNAIAVDADGNAYVTGQTEPAIVGPAFPPAIGAFQTGFAGVSDAYIAKISASGSSFAYASFLGGSGEDSGYGIAVDGSGNAFVTGLTYSTNFPTGGSAIQTTNGGAGDAFLTKVDTKSTGTASLVFSTYVGGGGLDQGNGVAVDGSGNIYVAGLANSSSFVFTPRGFQTTNLGQGDAFAAKFSTTGTLTYFTFLGGTKADSASGVAVDASGNAYITGTTVSTDFPTTASIFQPAYGGGNADSFVAKLDPAGTTLLYSSYLGGSNTELSSGIAVDTTGSAYVTGQTCSQDFPLSNPLQAVPGGNCDAYVSKVSILAGIALNPAGLVFPAQSLNATSQPQTITLTNGDNPVTINSIAISGANAGDFTQTNTCGTSLSAGAKCTITVTFMPTANGLRKASLTITDTAPGSPQVLNLSGSTSTVTLSSSNLSFANQQAGRASSAQSVTLTNSGSTPLTIASITASGDFSETDNCTKAVLQPTTQCVINVVYTPSTAGSSIGALTITDNGSGSPQIVLLTGTGFQQQPNFTVSAVQTSAAISAGQTATYTVMVSPLGGFTQPINLSCTGLPAGASCSISPNPVTPSGTTPASVKVSIGTTVRAMMLPTNLPSNRMGTRMGDGPHRLQLYTESFALLVMVLALFLTNLLRRRPAIAAFGFVVLLLLISTGCKGGGQAGVPAGTPVGTYQVSVTASSGSITHTTALTLQVN